jgi:hypothetical protein
MKAMLSVNKIILVVVATLSLRQNGPLARMLNV